MLTNTNTFFIDELLNGFVGSIEFVVIDNVVGRFHNICFDVKIKKNKNVIRINSDQLISYVHNYKRKNEVKIYFNESVGEV